MEECNQNTNMQLGALSMCEKWQASVWGFVFVCKFWYTFEFSGFVFSSLYLCVIKYICKTKQKVWNIHIVAVNK